MHQFFNFATLVVLIAMSSKIVSESSESSSIENDPNSQYDEQESDSIDFAMQQETDNSTKFSFDCYKVN